MKNSKKKSQFDKLSLEQRKNLFFKKCETREELSKFIQVFFGLYLPDQVVSRYADVSPLDVIWEVYDICVNKNNPKNIEELLYVAGRGSGKCVKRGTKILTPYGLKNIEEMTVGEHVFTGWSWQRVVETFDEGVKDGVTITTRSLSRSGAWSLTGSLKHRVQALDIESGKIDWVHMKNLVPGSIVYRSIESIGNSIDVESEDFEKGWIAGVVTGDGCVSRSGNNISVSGADFKQMRKYIELTHRYFNVSHSVKRTSKRSVTISSRSNREFRNWFKNTVEGDLCYFKKLKTINHSPNFLSGFIAGLMETDGSKDSITLANPDLISQIAQILNIFGVHSSVNKCRRKPSTTKFVKDHIVEYWTAEFKTALPEYLMPLFSKREAFLQHSKRMNEQFRYPAKLIKPFANFIKTKYEISNGYWRLREGRKTRSSVKYSKDLWGSGEKSRENYIYGYKIDYFIELSRQLGETEWAEYLSFIRRGCYEVVDTVVFDKHYFYDLEIEKDHSYWSNGFISHNTLGMAIAELLVMLHDSRDVCHVGAVLAQAKRCYEYQTNFMLSSRIRPILEDKNIPQEERILQKLNMEKSTFLIDGQTVTIEVLPCTLKALNGPHIPMVVTDEIDTVSGEGLKAFKEISGMLDTKGDKRALRVGISTRKSRYGLMNRMMEDADSAGRHVRRWTAWEFTERCPDERSGTVPTISYHIQDSMEVVDEATFKLKDPKKQKEYVQHTMPGEKCLQCPAAAICLGDAKKQASKSWMLKPVGELIKKVRSEGTDWALAQLMNLKPSVEGIIYKEFEEKIHVKDWNGMWKTLTGIDFPGECTHDIFVKKCHSMSLPCYAGVDWGWSNPNTVVYFFIDKRDNVYVVRSDGMTFVSQPEWIHYIKTKYNMMYRCQLYFPDIADQGAVTEMKKAGLPVSAQNDKSINTGIQVIKRLLRVPGSVDTKLHVAKETNEPLISEFLTYHFKTSADGTITEMPDNEYDHWLDALRYPLTMLLGKGTLVMGQMIELDKSNTVDSHGNYYKTPSPAEFCAANNMPINTEEPDPSRLGKIGRLNDIDEDEDSGSSGGFLWGF